MDLRNTLEQKLCEMEEVTDGFLKEMSKEISPSMATEENHVDYFKANRDVLFDEGIFGKPVSGNHTFAHINLERKVVNPNFVRGNNPCLAGMLKISQRDLEEIVYFEKGMATEDKDGLHLGQFVPVSEYLALEDKTSVIFGAELVEYLLNKEGILADGIILTRVPVIPLYLRVTAPENGHALTINSLYYELLNRASRVKKLEQLKCPEIILLNEYRILQEKMDALVCNGARVLSVNLYGHPHQSLLDYADVIKRKCRKDNSNLLSEAVVDKDGLCGLCKALMEHSLTIEDGEYASDDVRIVTEEELENKIREFFRAVTEKVYLATATKKPDFKDRVSWFVSVRIAGSFLDFLRLNMEEEGNLDEIIKDTVNEYCESLLKNIESCIQLVLKRQSLWM